MPSEQGASATMRLMSFLALRSALSFRSAGLLIGALLCWLLQYGSVQYAAGQVAALQLTPELIRAFLAYAFNQFIIQGQAYDAAERDRWRRWAEELLPDSEQLKLDTRTRLHFLAEYCFQESHKLKVN